MSDALRDFEIPLYNQRRLLGVFLAAHAIPDAIHLMHTGVGCKPKAQRQIVRHDRMREAQNKMVWSDVSDAHLIKGSAAQLRDMTLETVRRRNAAGGPNRVGLVVISESTAMELTGIDLAEVAADLALELDCPVIHVPGAGHRGDHHSGYAAVTRAVIRHVPWDEPITTPQAINLLGYPFDRYELDHAANLREFQRLLKGIGVSVGVTFLSGAPMAALARAAEAGGNLRLPHLLDGVAGGPDHAIPRRESTAELPLSSGGTRQFLERCAALADVPAARVERVHDREQEKIAPLVRIARKELGGRAALVLADTPRAAGLLATLTELDMSAPVVGLLDESLGGGAALEAALHRMGHALPAGTAVLPNPTARQVLEACERAGGPAGLDVALMPDLWLPPPLSDALPRVELGFPSNHKRALFALPEVGYNGVVALAQRLLDARYRVH